MIKASLIMPAFKRVDQTLKSLQLILDSDGFAKEFTLEIILADSTPDATLETVVKNQFGDRIIYTKSTTPGVASNKNQGAKIASYEILIFCDSDMEVEKDTLLKTFSALKKYPTAAGLGGRVLWRSGEKDGQIDRPREEDRRQEINGTTYIEALYSRYFVTFKKVFWEVGGYDEEVFNMRGEGSDLSIRYWRAGFPLVYDQNIIVHHVHDSPDSIALRIDHPEWGIAKDLLLLAYKYDMLGGDYPNFQKTVKANFAKLGDESYFRLIQGIGKYLDFIVESKAKIDLQKKTLKTEYDFKFLEVFTDINLCKRVVREAEAKFINIRKSIFS